MTKGSDRPPPPARSKKTGAGLSANDSLVAPLGRQPLQVKQPKRCLNHTARRRREQSKGNGAVKWQTEFKGACPTAEKG